MNNIFEILIIAVNTIFDCADTLLSYILNVGFLPEAVVGAVFSLAAAVMIVGRYTYLPTSAYGMAAAVYLGTHAGAPLPAVMEIKPFGQEATRR
jgi:hypothetical protein